MVFSNNLLMGAAAAAASSGGAAYVPGGSIILNGSDEYLHWTPSSTATSATKKTLSFWIKRAALGSVQWLIDAGSNNDQIQFAAANDLEVSLNATTDAYLNTTALYRDSTAWMHIVVSFDTGLEASSSRMRLWINGEVVTAFDTSNYPSADYALDFMADAVQQNIGRRGNNSQFFSGYLCEFIGLDGYAGLPSDFGTEDSNGLWVPKDPTDIVTANKGTNGFWLDFADSSDLGNDVSGNNNDFTPVNMGTTNSVLDRPADTAPTIGNYCTFNPGDKNSNMTLTNGNLTVANTGAAAFYGAIATLGIPNSGKWYFEVTLPASTLSNQYIGVVNEANKWDFVTAADGSTSTGFYGFYPINSTSSKVDNGSTSSYGGGIANGSVLGFAIDKDNDEMYVSDDGTFLASSNPVTRASPMLSSLPDDLYVAMTAHNSTSLTFNFGGSSFASTIPTGYKSLNTSNFPEPTVKNGENNFLPMLYEGNGAGQRIGNFIPFTDSHTVANSCLLKCESSQYLSLAKGNLTTPTGGTSSGNQKFTLSFWLKLTKNNNNPADGNGSMVYGTSADSGSGALQLQWAWNSTQGPAFNWTDWSNASGGGSNWLRRVLGNATTTSGPQGGRLMLDYSQWHHYVIAADWTSGGGLAGTDNCAKVYIDGQLQTLFMYDGSGLIKTNPATTNYSGMMSDITDQNIGWYPTGTRYGCFYMAEVVGVDGQQLDASVFGQTDTSTNRWIPKDPTSTLSSASDFGNNGFYLNMASANDLGNDVSGNGNDWTMNNMDTSGGANQIDDTPTQNVSLLDYSAPTSQTGSVTLSSGNRKVVGPSSAFFGVPSTMTLPSSGKFYAEAQINGAGTSSKGGGLYVMEAGTDLDVVTYTGGIAAVWGWHFQDNRHLVQDGSDTSVAVANADGDIAQIAIDIDNEKVYMGINNTWYSAVNTTTTAPDNSGTPTWTSFNCAGMQIAANGYGSSGSVVMNFGATDFAHTPPADFKALNQDNLEANTAGITGFSWIKNRDATDNHILQDRVMGIYNYISSNTADLKTTNANSVKRFLQQGVQIGNMDTINTSSESYVLWQWAANGAGTVIPADGTPSIPSTVSANTDAGFSVVKYTGTGSAATVGHGLSAAPSFIVNKTLGSGSTDPNWQVYHSEIGATKAMFFNTNGSPATSSTYWNNTAPSTTAPFVFSIGTDRDSAVEYINYCWVEVEGYSKFGSFTGNNSSDGPYINMGFAPSYFMFKRTDGNGDWYTFDSSRSPSNPATNILAYNQTKTESTMASDSSNGKIDFLSNGIQFRSGNGSDFNGSGATFIYAAWAENPFGGSGVGQARAR